MVTNPSNPLRTTMDRDELNLLIDFAITKKIHIVSVKKFEKTFSAHSAMDQFAQN